MTRARKPAKKRAGSPKGSGKGPRSKARRKPREIVPALSVHAFATTAGVDGETVARRLKSQGIEPAGRRGKLRLYALRDLLRITYVTDEHGRVDVDRLDSFRRRAHYQGELQRLELLRRAGELVDVDDMRREMARGFKLSVHAMETIPDLLERDAGATPAQVALAERVIDEVREQLYQSLIDDGNQEGKSDVARRAA